MLYPELPCLQPRRYATKRLDLIAATLDLITAELQHPKELGKQLNAKLTSEWPPEDYDDVAMEFLRDSLEQGGEPVIGWHGWYAVLRKERRLIGVGGYYGPPEGQIVEIGYTILPAYQMRGLATEMVAALVEMAFDHPHIACIRAHTHNTNIASIALLRKNAFEQVGGMKYDETLRFERLRKDE